MFEPDTAQFAVGCILALLLFGAILYHATRFLSYQAQGGAALFAVLSMAAVLGFSIYGYGKANLHWESLTSALDGKQIEQVLVVYPYNEVEAQKTRSIEGVVTNYAASIDRIEAVKSFIPDSRRIIIGLKNKPPAAERKELKVAFETVYHMQTWVEYHDPSINRSPS